MKFLDRYSFWIKILKYRVFSYFVVREQRMQTSKKNLIENTDLFYNLVSLTLWRTANSSRKARKCNSWSMFGIPLHNHMAGQESRPGSSSKSCFFRNRFESD